MTEYRKVNPTTPAPLKNVAAFSTLLARMVGRNVDEGLAVFHGQSGLGKSRAATYGAKTYRARYIEVGQYTTARSLLANLLKELGQPDPRGTIEDLKEQVIEIMAADPRQPVIIDEAHFIAAKRFVDLVREISDKSGAPVILIGEDILPNRLATFERVYGRVLEWLQAQPCDAEDFAHMATYRCPGIRVAPDLATAILGLTKGNTRFVNKNLVKVVEIAQLTGASTIDLATFGGVHKIDVLRTAGRQQ